jgi:hypothetical protein
MSLCLRSLVIYSTIQTTPIVAHKSPWTEILWRIGVTYER